MTLAANPMSSRDAKKAKFERRIARALFTAMPDLPYKAWRSSDDPEIDVIVERSDGAMIALEVTRLHPSGGAAARRWEGAQDRILVIAESRYLQSGGPELEVVVFWSNWVDPTGRPLSAIGAELAAFVAANLPPENGERDISIEDENEPELPYAVDRVLIRHFPGVLKGWHSPRSGFVPDLARDDIQERLTAKAGKPKRYRLAYAERWLVLAVGAEGRSTWANVPNHLGVIPFESTFDRAFVVRPPNTAVELLLTTTS